MNIRTAILSAMLLLLTSSVTEARAELQEVKINGKTYSESLNEAASQEFNPNEGLTMTRSARIAKAKQGRQHSDASADKCFRLMREAASAGECSRTFWAEDAACAEEEANGCFENKRFLRKLDRLGFRVSEKTLEEEDEGACKSVTAQWCEVTHEREKKHL